ncbi:MAG: hypothetical protein CTY20_02710 [Hyphomicrobium sp.]|nr:MAG: hypothetical protein CTY20_02710 [Hyphomicrobium sp.]
MIGETKEWPPEFLKEMMPEWRKKGLTITVPVFQGGQRTAGIEAALRSLGFAPSGADNLSKYYVAR